MEFSLGRTMNGTKVGDIQGFTAKQVRGDEMGVGMREQYDY
jgi:hypothetical protein